MAVSRNLTTTLANPLLNISFSSLDFLQNCSNVALGVQVYQNEFGFNRTTAADWRLAIGHPTVEWIDFWRAILPSKYRYVSDQWVSNWTNHSDFTYFFDPSNGNEDVGQMDTLATIANHLSSGGGCQERLFSATKSITDFLSRCMFQYCCSPHVDEKQLGSTSKLFPYYQNWTLQDACAFRTCSDANHGNPDLGGKGIIVSYYIELSLLAYTCLILAFRWLPTAIYSYLKTPIPNWVDRHPQAFINAAAAFLDSAAYLSLSVSIAGIVFDTTTDPLLYDDKLGQASTLLAVNAPIATLLLTYQDLERKKTRYLLVILAALLTFAIQFVFRKAKAFNPSLSSCLDWSDTDLSDRFKRLFIVTGAWATLVTLFFIFHTSRWLISSFRRRSSKATAKTQTGVPDPSAQHNGGLPNLKSSSSPSTRNVSLLSCLSDPRTWSDIIATVLACYSVVNSFLALNFIKHLRDTEKNISSKFEDDAWGYGQILALFIWVPVIAEYVHGLYDVFVMKRDVHGQGRNLHEE